MPDSSHISVPAPLEPFAPGFASELARQGYVPRVVVHHLHLMAAVSRWLTAQALQVVDLPREAARFLHWRRVAGHTRYVTARACSRCSRICTASALCRRHRRRCARIRWT